MEVSCQNRVFDYLLHGETGQLIFKNLGNLFYFFFMAQPLCHRKKSRLSQIAVAG
jgi:hypothetical protein